MGPFSIVMAVLGVMLIVKGIRGQGGGVTRCGACGANLAGRDAAFCPDCGIRLAALKGKRRGRRLRRGPLIAGIILLLMSGALNAMLSRVHLLGRPFIPAAPRMVLP